MGRYQTHVCYIDLHDSFADLTIREQNFHKVCKRQNPKKCDLSFADPILPDLLYRIELHPDEFVSQSFITKAIKLPANETSALQGKTSVQIAILVGLKPLLEVFLNVAVGFLVER